MTEHTTAEPPLPPRNQNSLAKPWTLYPYIELLVLSVFVCAAFTTAGAWAVCLSYLKGDFAEEDGFLFRQALKGFLFLILAAGAAGTFWRMSRGLSTPSKPTVSLSSAWSKPILAGALILAALAVFPRLHLFPGAAPDEIYHLTVAKNLADSGAYASGHPDTGFVYFDHYDSVGPTVLGPIAAVFRTFGVSLFAARFLIAISFIVLCVLAYRLASPQFGQTGAAIGVLMMVVAFGSIYLGRTLYGEVPALALLFGGLLCWRASLDGRPGIKMAVFAGILFGLCALAKTFMLVASLAICGVWFYDRAHNRVIRGKHIAVPLLCVVAVLAAWWAVEVIFADPNAEQVSVLMFYRHLLLFGVPPSQIALAWLAARPVTVAIAIVALVHAFPVLFRERYDPAMGVLLLMAILYAFWWMFFTPGQIPRYLWYSMAIAGLCSGHLLERCTIVIRRGEAWTKTALAAGIIAAALGSGAWRAAAHLDGVYLRDEVSDEYALAEFVKALPANAAIATAYWPVEWSLNFFAGRTLEVVSGFELDTEKYDVLIADTQTQDIPAHILKASRRIGRYVIVTPGV